MLQPIVRLPRSEATEALALWRGVEAASGARDLLQLCGSLDVAAGGGGPGADALQAMQEASQVRQLWQPVAWPRGCLCPGPFLLAGSGGLGGGETHV
jgi:hypothetical protein